MLHYLEVGGPILWVLVIISIGAFAVVLERIVFLQGMKRMLEVILKMKYFR